jgi:uncharacterized membrane protein
VLPPLFFSSPDADAAPLAGCYGRICHQLPERCFFVDQVPLSLCARCVGFYGAIFAVSLALLLARRRPQLPLIWGLALALPGLVDVVFDFGAATAAANLIRLGTGFAAGAGVTAYAYPRYLDLISR